MLGHGHLEVIGSGFNPHGDPVPLKFLIKMIKEVTQLVS
jgi:hypothetical protein